jgi:phage shock protein C
MNTGASDLYLGTDNRLWFGVCAGIANWLDIPAAIVRIVFILCVLAWPGFIIGYFVMYFCLDRDFTPDKMRDYFRDTPSAAHFRKLNYRKPICKNERNKKIAGVCAGFADYLEVSTFSVRLVTLLSMFVFGPFTFWAYIICWIVFDPDPNMGDQERYSRIMRRRERRAEKRRNRHARRAARRQARASRKRYDNEEIDPDMSEFEQDISDAVDEVNIELKAEIDSAASGFTRKQRDRSGKPKYGAYRNDPAETTGDSRQECTEIYASLERRLREIEAFMTSKRFRLHCEINRI